MPILDKFLAKNPIIKPAPSPFTWAFEQGYAALTGRKAERDAGITHEGSPDFLDQFINARTTYPDIVDSDDKVVNYLFLNISA